MSAELLGRLAQRVSDPEYDARHAVLDITADLRALADDSGQWPERFQREFAELLLELDELQPVFPSQRRTSVLFDRESLGQTGVDRAKRFIARLVSLARSLHRHAGQ